MRGSNQPPFPEAPCRARARAGACVCGCPRPSTALGPQLCTYQNLTALNDSSMQVHTPVLRRNNCTDICCGRDVPEHRCCAWSQIVVPRTYHELTTRRVLTSQWIDGEKLSQSAASDVGTLVQIGDRLPAPDGSLSHVLWSPSCTDVLRIGLLLVMNA